MNSERGKFIFSLGVTFLFVLGLTTILVITNREAIMRVRDRAISKAARRGDLKNLQLLLLTSSSVNGAKGAEMYPLVAAARAGHNDIVRFLLAAGADINAADFSGTPLMAAIAERRIETVKLLLEKGADPKAGSYFGTTALNMAVQAGQLEIVKLIIPRVDVKSKATPSPLAIAILQRRMDIVHLLLDNGVKMEDSEKQSMLEMARRMGNEEIIKALGQLE